MPTSRDTFKAAGQVPAQNAATIANDQNRITSLFCKAIIGLDCSSRHAATCPSPSPGPQLLELCSEASLARSRVSSPAELGYERFSCHDRPSHTSAVEPHHYPLHLRRHSSSSSRLLPGAARLVRPNPDPTMA